MTTTPAPEPQHLAALLLPWFDRVQRRMPWRETRDPYCIWVSEIMLQQTQVDTVIPYYERFLLRFPTLAALAASPLDDVLHLWAGLGYYSRARHLHQAAQVMVREHDGRFPEDLKAALALPGVGRYTAGAILSIAYGQSHPALDGNVRRVLARVFLLRGDLDRGPLKKRLEQVCAEAVPSERPGAHNQALMELGAMVCLPSEPHCQDCPLGGLCLARREGLQQTIPPARSLIMRQVTVVAALVRKGAKVLLAQRPASGIWGGLWEFPQVELQPTDDPAQVVQHLLADDFRLQVEVGEKIAGLVHGITNRRITLSLYEARVLGGRLRPAHHQQVRWVTVRELDDYALPAPHRKLARSLI